MSLGPLRRASHGATLGLATQVANLPTPPQFRSSWADCTPGDRDLRTGGRRDRYRWRGEKQGKGRVESARGCPKTIGHCIWRKFADARRGSAQGSCRSDQKQRSGCGSGRRALRSQISYDCRSPLSPLARDRFRFGCLGEVKARSWVAWRHRQGGGRPNSGEPRSRLADPRKSPQREDDISGGFRATRRRSRTDTCALRPGAADQG